MENCTPALELKAVLMLKEKDGSYKMNLGIGFKDGKSIEFMPEEQHDILCLIKKELNCFLSPFLGKLARLTYDLVDIINTFRNVYSFTHCNVRISTCYWLRRYIIMRNIQL